MVRGEAPPARSVQRLRRYLPCGLRRRHLLRHGLHHYNGFTYIVDRRGPLPWGLKRLRAPSILKQYSSIPGYTYLHDTNNHLLVSEGEVMFVGMVLTAQEPGCPKSVGGF